MANQLDELLQSFSQVKHTEKNTFPVTRILYVIGIICILGSILMYLYYKKADKNSIIIETYKNDQNIKKDIFIDISGAVMRPGLYQLPEGSRVGDAIASSGGILAEANKSWVQRDLNLAQILNDGQKLYIPFEGENEASNPQIQGQNTSSKVNINTASAEQLESLPKIGPKTAQAIITFREEHGNFASPEELVLVPGIGEKTLENLKDLVITY